MKYKKIALIGMMGSGKTSVAHLLSKAINLKYFDSDFEFEKKYKITIKEYFEKYSQEEFRKAETQILKKITSLSEFILSSGGGAILSKENRDMLFNKDILTIYLSACANTIYERLKEDSSRPLLQVKNPKEEIEKIIDARKNFYNMATKTISTDNKTIDEVVREIQWIL